ncbi:MAG: IMP dehydrogenase [Candidatus Woesearchaeota archaeon]
MKEGLTYADVLLVPKKTPLASRTEAHLSTQWSKNIKLNVPLVSANMATVTEHEMAIAMARQGGLGIIHQFSSIEEQAEEVRKVKRSTGHVIDDPLALSGETTIHQAKQVMMNMGVSSVLVTKGNELVGIATGRDFLFEDDDSKMLTSVMTPREKLITADKGISIEQAKKILHEHRIEKLPLLDKGKLVGLMTSRDIENLERWKLASRDEKGRLRVGAAVGVKDAIERSEALLAAGADCIVMDMAHAHSELAIKQLKAFKNKFDADIIVGNIATGEAAKDLIEAGADGLKVGIGPSPVCTTRLMSGAGVPQLTAVMEVCAVAKKYGIPVTADGGMQYPGDAVKALAAGASTVYSGNFFAGTNEAPGRIVIKDGKRYKRYIGSASYDSNHERREKLTGMAIKTNLDVFVEGVSSLVPYKGPVDDVIESILKGIRSGMSYCGSRTITEMQANSEFIKITAAGFEENQSRGFKTSE